MHSGARNQFAHEGEAVREGHITDVFVAAFSLTIKTKQEMNFFSSTLPVVICDNNSNNNNNKDGLNVNNENKNFSRKRTL